MKHCDYEGCTKPLAPDQEGGGMKFCAEHLKELLDLVNAEKWKAVIAFWIRTQGGAEKAARR